MSNNNTKILVIGSSDDAHLIQESLKIADTQFDVINEYSLESALKCLTSNIFDSIILDTNLLDKGGLEILKNIARKFPDLPIVTLLTDIKNKDVATGTLQMQDYILREDITKETGGDIILRSIKYVIELKKITGALKESERRYKHITETVLEELWIIDKEGNTSYISEQMAQRLGYAANDIVSHPFINFIDHIDREKAKQFFELRKQDTKTKYDFNFVKKDGSTICLIISANSIFDKGQFIGSIGLFADITEYRQTIDKLRESEAKYRLIFDKAPIGITHFDINGEITSCNTYLAEILGASIEKIIGFDMKYGVTNVKARAAIQEVLSGRIGQFEDNYVSITGGKSAIIKTTYSPLFSEDGSPMGGIGITEDITERKNAEEKLDKAYKDLERSNKELEQFAYVASHDLQEPLRTIYGYTELLESNYKDKLDTDADDFITYITTGARRMQQMINDILALSRITTKGKEFVPVNTERILKIVFENLHSLIDKNQAIITYDPMPTIMADDSQIIQLFQNLIENAIKFHKEETLKIHISCKRKNGEWVFSVKDNGIGIDKDQFKKLFIIFQRLHSREEYPGTGIGLVMCKKIVERHGGTIWVESEVGMGSTFYFTIPITPTSTFRY